MNQVHVALARRFGGCSWQCSTEVEVPYDTTTRHWARRFDFVAANVSSGRSFSVIGVEVKVTRSDFLAEQKDTTKFSTLQLMTHLAYYAAPRGLIKSTELPVGAGLLELGADGRLRETVRPVKNEQADTSLVLAGMMRRTYAASMAQTLRAIAQQFDIRTPVLGYQDPDWWTRRLALRSRKGVENKR